MVDGMVRGEGGVETGPALVDTLRRILARRRQAGQEAGQIADEVGIVAEMRTEPLDDGRGLRASVAVRHLVLLAQINAVSSD